MEKKQKIIYEEGDIFNAFLDFRNDLTEELKKVIEMWENFITNRREKNID